MPGKSHEWRSLAGCYPWARQESATAERLHFPFSLSCIGEGNGNPHQCSCLENPRDGEAWWAAVYGVAQSQIRLKRCSSSSSSIISLGSKNTNFIISIFLNFTRFVSWTLIWSILVNIPTSFGKIHNKYMLLSCICYK